MSHSQNSQSLFSAGEKSKERQNSVASVASEPGSDACGPASPTSPARSGSSTETWDTADEDSDELCSMRSQLKTCHHCQTIMFGDVCSVCIASANESATGPPLHRELSLAPPFKRPSSNQLSGHSKKKSRVVAAATQGKKDECDELETNERQ